MPQFLYSRNDSIDDDPGRIETHPSIVAARKAADNLAHDIGGAVYVYRIRFEALILPPTENPTHVTATSSGPDHHKPKAW